MADIFEIEIPDMAYRCAKAYNERIKPYARERTHMVCLSSAFNYFFNHMDLSDTADAVVTAAKASGGVGSDRLSGRQWSTGAFCRASGRFGQRLVLRDWPCARPWGLPVWAHRFPRLRRRPSPICLGEHCAWGCIVALLENGFRSHGGGRVRSGSGVLRGGQ